VLKTNPEQVLKALVLLAADEQAALRKVRASHRWFKIGGFGVMFVAFFLAFNPSFGVPCWVLAAVAAFGGALAGLALWFENSLVQWPVLKQYLDLERLRGLSKDKP
jgi:uncharacterized membrane protein YdcZ (DUF606 family)